MMKRHGLRSAVLLVIGAMSIGLVAVPVSHADAPAGAEAFDWAFRFASAIKADPKDMARAQESVVTDLADAGRLDEATSLAERIEGWRRGTALADIAGRLAGRGQTEEAKALLARAGKISESAGGWEGPRVEAHMAQALATIGDTTRADAIGQKLAAEDRQYAGRSVATQATGLARQGKFQEAMESLKALDGNDDIDVGWWRTAGYLAVAKQEKLSASDRRKALDAARASAETVADWRKAESLQSVAEEYSRIGAKGETKECLEIAERTLTPLPATMSIRAALMSNLARSWSKAGEKSKAKALLARASENVDAAMLTERPAIWANVASSYAAIGDQETAWQTFDRALKVAATLENARPRALSIVSICRSIGKQGLTLPQPTRTTLEALYKGLQDPW